MKRIISLILTLIMIVTLAAPVAYAAEAQNEITPIIFLRGNGEDIRYENGAGELVLDEIDQVLGSIEFEKEGFMRELTNILIPFITKGLPRDEWDECRKAIYTAISPFFDQCIMDGDGNPRLGTTISTQAQWNNLNPNVNNAYSAGNLAFHYDWRCDPYENADLLDAFVDRVLAATGKSQVSFVSRCMGGTLLNAYLERYGHTGKIKNVLYGDTLGGGSTILSKLFSGKVSIDGKNTQRYLGQLEYCAQIGQGVGFALPELLDEIVTTTLDLFTQVNVTDVLGDKIEGLYNELLIMIFPALMHATGYATTPNYWTCVREEDFDEAMLLMFGEEGSEGREYYAGLIDKITYYREHVTAKGDDFVKDMSAYAHIGSVAKYGFLNVSLVEDNDIHSDALASLEHATFGATVAKVGTTLSDDYIAARVAEGNGKYISPDKVVDTSTTAIKDATWVFKNAHHNHADMVFAIANVFCKGTNVTVENSGFARFNMYDVATNKWTEMTEDNCDVELEFMTRAEKEPNLMTKLAAGLRFLTMIFKLLTKVISGEISFDAFGKLLGK